jgi:hypothetical protein
VSDDALTFDATVAKVQTLVDNELYILFKVILCDLFRSSTRYKFNLLTIG